MTQITMTFHTYIFYCNGVFFEQNTFASDDDAYRHANNEKAERGKEVLVARWLEPLVKPIDNGLVAGEALEKGDAVVLDKGVVRRLHTT